MVSERQMEKLRAQVLQYVDRSRDVTDQEIYDRIDQVLIQRRSGHEHIGFRERCILRRDLFFALRKLGILQELIEDSEITEIMINGTEGIFIEKNGRLYRWEKCFSSRQRLEDLIQQIVGKSNRVVNEADPIVDTRLENGSRVHVVLAPVAINGPIVTIRRFPDEPITMNDLICWGSLTPEAARFLEMLVQAGYNIFISGGTGSGKTTLLNVLSGCIPIEQRVITIEDSAELQLQNQPNLVRLETRGTNGESTREIDIRELIRASLRMRPDRIIVGEVRGAEALDMLQALNTGHDGSLSTGHANSTRDMLSRLETMVLMGKDLPLEAIRRQIATGLDILVHLGRMRDRTRKVLEIAEIECYRSREISLRTLFVYEEEAGGTESLARGSLQRKNTLLHTQKLQAAGLWEKEKRMIHEKME